jgi:hypothetical protein
MPFFRLSRKMLFLKVFAIGLTFGDESNRIVVYVGYPQFYCCLGGC